jgi:DNA-binding MarR family transcriptional regulator
MNINEEMEPVEKKRATESVHASSLLFAGGTFARQVEKLAKEMWKPSGLSPSQAQLLLHILDNDFAFPVYICQEFQVGPSTITRLAEKLEKKGLAGRYDMENGGTFIMATEEGRKLKPVLEGCERAFAKRCNALLGEQEAFSLACRLNKASDELAGY